MDLDVYPTTNEIKLFNSELESFSVPRNIQLSGRNCAVTRVSSWKNASRFRAPPPSNLLTIQSLLTVLTIQNFTSIISGQLKRTNGNSSQSNRQVTTLRASLRIHLLKRSTKVQYNCNTRKNSLYCSCIVVALHLCGPLKAKTFSQRKSIS